MEVEFRGSTTPGSRFPTHLDAAPLTLITTIARLSMRATRSHETSQPASGIGIRLGFLGLLDGS